MAASKQIRVFDVVVVGAGVIGLSCAWRAAREGLEVCVVEASRPGAGASGVAAGMLAPVGEASFGEEALLELNSASLGLWPEFASELEAASATSCGYLPLGAIHVALDADESSELRRSLALHERSGLTSRWLSAAECRELEPGLSPSLAGGILAEGEAAVDPGQTVEALVAALHAESVDLVVEREVAALETGGEYLQLTLSDGMPIRAQQLVVAAGAWSPLLDWLPSAAHPPVRPVKGQIIELGPAPGVGRVCERIICGERFYAVPRDDGRLVVGATVEERGYDDSVTAGGVFELLREAYRALPELAELSFVGVGAGLRPTTPDNAPVIGRVADHPSVILACGHFRNGILLAPITAHLVSDLLAGREPRVALAPFDPSRFGQADRQVPLGAER